MVYNFRFLAAATTASPKLQTNFGFFTHAPGRYAHPTFFAACRLQLYLKPYLSLIKPTP
jgi:hypothetical protein